MGGAFNPGQLEFLIRGVTWTVALSLAGLAGGGALALLFAFCRVCGLPAVRTASGAVVQLVQDTPLLVILFLAYYGLPVPALLAVAASLSLYVGAHLGEIWGAAIQAVPQAQWEAAECLGLRGGQRLVRVILPQAVRIATPPTVGFMVQIIKNSSLASTIGFFELTRSAQIIDNSLLRPFLAFAVIAAVYFAMCYPLSRLSRRLEAK